MSDLINHDGEHSVLDMRELFGNMIPPASGLGIIKALEVLASRMEKDGKTVIKFDAGLPDHARDKKVKDELALYAQDDFAHYARYQIDPSKINEQSVLPDAYKYHTEVVGLDVAKDTNHFQDKNETPEGRFLITEGSTPVLNHAIRLQAMEKARLDGRALGEGCVLELFELTYPLYELPAKDAGMTVANGGVTKDIKIFSKIDVKDGQPIVSQPFQIDRASLSASFDRNRHKVATLVFCNPANPSGYKLSEDEMDFMADELLQDFRIRRLDGIPAKLVIEDIAYLTMMHDENDKPYTLAHAFHKKIDAELAKDKPDHALIQELRACRETVLTIHSLSKAAAEAGDRVAYTEGNPVLINALRELYVRDMLSHSNPPLHAARGAFQAGKPPREVMGGYSERVKTFEQGMNDAFFNVVAQDDMALTEAQIQRALPFSNQSSGSFFTVMSLKPLLGQAIDPATAENVKTWIGRIENEGIRNSFGKVFENDTINDEKDLALYFMFKTLEHGGKAISCVPLSGGMVRFSMGMTPVDKVQEAVEAAKQFFAEDPVYRRAIAERGPDAKVEAAYRIDSLGVPTQVAL